MSLLGATVLLLVLLTGAVYAVALMRRRFGARSRGADVAESQRRFLASNWSEIERVAAQHGMDEAQLAEVRRKVFGG